jgi:hypothetical protein
MRISVGAVAGIVLFVFSALPACTKTVYPVGPGAAPLPATPPAASVAPATEAAGLDKENPVVRCGPRDSYVYVASEFRCADGTNPLAGDRRAAARTRKGNAGRNSRGHVVDIYLVPCPEGPRRVFVSMYGCPEYERFLRLDRPTPK